MKLTLLFIAVLLGERAEDPQDLLQKVQEAPASQSYPVQEGQRFSLCPGWVKVSFPTKTRWPLGSRLVDVLTSLATIFQTG